MHITVSGLFVFRFRFLYETLHVKNKLIRCRCTFHETQTRSQVHDALGLRTSRNVYNKKLLTSEHYSEDTARQGLPPKPSLSLEKALGPHDALPRGLTNISSIFKAHWKLTHDAYYWSGYAPIIYHNMPVYYLRNTEEISENSIHAHVHV